MLALWEAELLNDTPCSEVWSLGYACIVPYIAAVEIVDRAESAYLPIVVTS